LISTHLGNARVDILYRPWLIGRHYDVFSRVRSCAYLYTVVLCRSRTYEKNVRLDVYLCGIKTKSNTDYRPFDYDSCLTNNNINYPFSSTYWSSFAWFLYDRARWFWLSRN